METKNIHPTTYNNIVTNKMSVCLKLTSRKANALFLLLRTVLKLCVLQLVLNICVKSAVTLGEQRFAMEPQDQTAIAGSRVTLPCRVENKVGQLQWTKDDFGLGTHRHLSGYERYRMIGSDDEGDYSLDIRDVTLDDDASYQCQVSSGPRGEPPIRSRYAKLTVLVSPDPPRVLQGSEVETIEEQDLSLDCVSVGGKPAAEITWVSNDGSVLTQGVTYTIEPMEDGRRFTARSVLTLRPRRSHHNQTFTCQAQNTADRTYKATTVKLLVKYAPKVRMFVRSSSSTIKEGDDLIAGCHASANPNVVSYKWYFNNEKIITNVTTELVIRNITRKHNDGSIRCEAFNDVGKSSESKIIEVSYPPSFLVTPQNIVADSGTIVTMSCVVDSHPKPEISWLHYEKGRIIKVGRSSNLTITVTAHSAGQYWCRAAVEGYRDIEAMATVYVKGPPKILSNRTQYGIEGDSVKLDCISFSIPKPDYVLWTHAGQEISFTNNQEYAFFEETLQDGTIKSSLIIKESQDKHFGLYNCTVANMYGTDSSEINLMPDKSFPLIIIISGGASSAIIVLMVMLVIMLCHRRCRKNIPDEIKKPEIVDVKHDGKDSRHSTLSDFKMELKQIEGNCEIDNKTNTLETEFQNSMHMHTSMGLPLAGPVPLPVTGFENELMKQYRRYSADLNEQNHLQFKMHETNGYVPYVDYSRDYIPPAVQSTDSLTDSMTRSIDTASTAQCNSLTSMGQSYHGVGFAGPDVIPMTTSGVDVRYAATYGNPYLRINGALTVVPKTSSNTSSAAPPPYYTVKSLQSQHTLSDGAKVSSLSSLNSRSTMSSSSASSGAQPQVPNSPHSSGALYVLPASKHSSTVKLQKTKGYSSKNPITHV